MCASKRFGKFAVLFLFLLTCLGSSIPVSAEAEEEPEVLTAIASADVFFSGFLIAEGDTLELEESQYYLEDAVSYLIAYNENGGEALLLAEISGWETVDIQTAGSYTVTVHRRFRQRCCKLCACSGVGEHFHSGLHQSAGSI